MNKKYWLHGWDDEKIYFWDEEKKKEYCVTDEKELWLFSQFREKLYHLLGVEAKILFN